jgi:hypothetical protein
MKAHSFILGIAASSAVPVAMAAPYSVPASTIDAGGARATSASYSQTGSVGGIAGISTASAPAETAKHGYIGQLTEVTGLQLAASPTTLNETTTRQVTAAQMLDDATTQAVDAATVNWSAVSGPIGSVSASGLVTATTVYQTTGATVQGTFAGNIGTLGLSVMNVEQDDYQAYAADGIDDDWQVLYFGAPPNANAGPTADPDHDGQKNLFEFLAGVVPNDPASRFLFRIEPVAGQPLQKKLVFSPRRLDRTYTVESNTDLGASWTTVSATTLLDNGTERTVTDPNASGAKKFYHVRIEKP